MPLFEHLQYLAVLWLTIFANN